MTSYGDDDDEDDKVQTVVAQAKDLLPAHLHERVGEDQKAPLPAAGRPAIPSAPPAAGVRATPPSVPLAAVAPPLPPPLPPPPAQLAARAAETIALPRERPRMPMGFLIYMTACVVMTAVGIGLLVSFKLSGRW